AEAVDDALVEEDPIGDDELIDEIRNRRRRVRSTLLGSPGQRRSRRALHRAYASRADLLWVPLQLALLPPVLRHTAWALRDRSPVAVAEPASYALLATAAAEKVLAVTLRH